MAIDCKEGNKEGMHIVLIVDVMHHRNIEKK